MRLTLFNLMQDFTLLSCLTHMTRNVDGTGQKLEAAYIHESQETIQR